MPETTQSLSTISFMHELEQDQMNGTAKYSQKFPEQFSEAVLVVMVIAEGGGNQENCGTWRNKQMKKLNILLKKSPLYR